MNREIKFRGKRLDNGNWHYGNYVDGIGGKAYIMDFASVETDAFSFYEVDPETVGQYTGAKDFIGKEIYEGDMLSPKWLVYIIRAIDGCWTVVFLTNPKVNKPKSLLAYLKSREKAGTQDRDNIVIGNRFDHPELLK